MKKHNNNRKRISVKRVATDDSPTQPAKQLNNTLVKSSGSPKVKPLIPDDLSTSQKVSAYFGQLLKRSRSNDAAAALVPWICDRLPSFNSRQAYAGDLTAFVLHMTHQGIDPLAVTGDDMRIYKEALVRSGRSAATISRVLSCLRGTFEQFGKKGLIEWERVQDIQAVKSPRVNKNTTPALSEAEATKLLHTPDTSTILGLRDHAMLFCFFRTACRVSPIAKAKVGDLEWTDKNCYLVVTEKGGKRQRKALLESTSSILNYIEAGGIANDLVGPLFRPVERDRRTLAPRHITRRTVLNIVKKYARRVGIEVDRIGRRGVGVHSLRKTAITNALEHGAKMEKVQQLAGHSDIRTTQLYFNTKERDSEDAARHIQIR